MFDIGWLELLLIGIVALIVVGPEDLPGMFRTAGRFMGRMRGMAREFQRSMEEAADQTGLKEATSGLNKMRDFGVGSPTKSARAYADSLLKDDAGSTPKAATAAGAAVSPTAAADSAEAAEDLADADAAEAAEMQMPVAGAARNGAAGAGGDRAGAENPQAAASDAEKSGLPAPDPKPEG